MGPQQLLLCPGSLGRALRGCGGVSAFQLEVLQDL